MTDLQTADAWRLLIAGLPAGAVLTDASSRECVVVYANPAFESLTGYPLAELRGRGLPVFGDQTDGPASHPLREAMQAGVETRSLARCRHRDGTALWLDFSAAPVRSADGRVTHWASLFRAPAGRDATRAPGTGRYRAMTPRLAGRTDVLTGLGSRAAFEAALDRAAGAPHGKAPASAVFVVDIDDLTSYNETFGRSAGDALLKRVAAALEAAFRRSSDLLTRWDGGTFAAVTHGMEAGRVQEHAEALRARVRDLCIHHPHSRYGRYVSVSVAVAAAPAGAGAALEALLDEAFATLRGNKRAGQPVLAARRRARR